MKNDLLIQPTKMIITEAGLQIQKSGKISLFDWQTIDSVDSQKEFFHIRMVDKKFFLVPKSAFKGYSEELIFLATVKNNILKTKPANYNPSKQKPPYWLGIFCFIPLIGAFVGFVFIILGVTKFKDKWFTIIGAGGILFTIVTYSSLFYTMKNSSLIDDSLGDFAKTEMGNLVKDIEFYKTQHGQYPDSLKQLLKDDSSININDPLQSNNNRSFTDFYYTRKNETYLLFSAGKDGIPNTADDLFPKITITDSSKIGLRFDNTIK